MRWAPASPPPRPTEISSGLRPPPNSRAEAITQPFLGIMVRRLWQVLAYFYSQQGPVYLELLKDDTFRLKQKETHCLSATCTYCEKRKAKIILKEPFLPERLMLWTSISTLLSHDIKQYRYLYMVLMATWILSAVFLPINSYISVTLQKMWRSNVSEHWSLFKSLDVRKISSL